MGSWSSKVVASVVFIAAATVAAPALASQNIPWTWNSGDHDAEAKFTAYGEVYHGRGYEPDSYVDWTSPGASGRGIWVSKATTRA